MVDDVGNLRVDIEIESLARPGQRRLLAAVVVDDRTVLSWAPAAVLESLGVARNNRWRFRRADGTVLERWTGSVVIHVAGRQTADEVVFAEPGDSNAVGFRTLRGVNLRIDPVTLKLVDAGPAPAAAAA